MSVIPETELPHVLPDAEAAKKYGPGAHEGASYRERLEGWVEEAEDARNAIESTFDVALGEDEDDLPLMDQLLESWRAEPPEEEELARIALAWGAYLGELVILNLGGAWVLRDDPLHNSVRFPRLELQVFPVHALLRALTLGEPLERGYEELVTTLCA